MPKVDTSGRRAWIVRSLILLAIVFTSFAWASASPVGASPDEPDHITYAWGSSTGQTLPWVAEDNLDSLVGRLSPSPFRGRCSNIPL